jgi:hypothetical protein
MPTDINARCTAELGPRVIKMASSIFLSYFFSTALHSRKLNVVVDWLTLLLRIREVPGPILCPKTVYPDRFYVVSFSLSRQLLK